MNLPKYLLLNSKELPGIELMLCTESPLYLFRAYKFESYKAKEAFAIKYNVILDAGHIPGYNILICCVGTLTTYYGQPVLGHNVTETVKQTIKELIKFYEKERIKGNETRLKKYAIK